MTIGERLQEERARLGLKQPDLFRITGISKKTISGYENDKTYPNAEFLAAIAAVGLDIAYILTGKRVLKISEASAGYDLRPDQKALLDNYENCTPESRKFIARVADHEAQPNDSGQPVEQDQGTKQAG